jgi:hypothetical protein
MLQNFTNQPTQINPMFNLDFYNVAKCVDSIEFNRGLSNAKDEEQKKLSKIPGSLQSGNLFKNNYSTTLFFCPGAALPTSRAPNSMQVLYHHFYISLLLPSSGTKRIISYNSLQLRKLYPSSWTTA